MNLLIVLGTLVPVAAIVLVIVVAIYVYYRMKSPSDENSDDSIENRAITDG